MARLLPPGPLGAIWAPLAALGFILRRPRLWWLTFTPFVINLGLVGLFFWIIWWRFQQWFNSLLPGAGTWWGEALYYLLAFLTGLLILVVSVYLFTVLGRIVAAPFLEALTVKVERELGRSGEFADIGIMASMGRVAWQESKKLLIYLVLMLVLLALNFLPGLGTMAYALLAFLLTSFFLASDFLDYPLERRGYSLGAKLGYVRRLGLSGIGFGAAIFVTCLVPFLNLATLPLSAVGGTLLYLDRTPASPLRPEQPPSAAHPSS